MAEIIIGEIEKRVKSGERVVLQQPELNIVQREAVLRQAEKFGGSVVNIGRVELMPQEQGDDWILFVKVRAGMIGFEVETSINNSFDNKKGGLVVNPDNIKVKGGGIFQGAVKKIARQILADPVGELERTFGLEENSLGIRFVDNGLEIWDAS